MPRPRHRSEDLRHPSARGAGGKAQCPNAPLSRETGTTPEFRSNDTAPPRDRAVSKTIPAALTRSECPRRPRRRALQGPRYAPREHRYPIWHKSRRCPVLPVLAEGARNQSRTVRIEVFLFPSRIARAAETTPPRSSGPECRQCRVRLRDAFRLQSVPETPRETPDRNCSTAPARTLRKRRSWDSPSIRKLTLRAFSRSRTHSPRQCSSAHSRAWLPHCPCRQARMETGSSSLGSSRSSTLSSSVAPMTRSFRPACSGVASAFRIGPGKLAARRITASAAKASRKISCGKLTLFPRSVSKPLSITSLRSSVDTPLSSIRRSKSRTLKLNANRSNSQAATCESTRMPSLAASPNRARA